jgi:hypothetical protein
VSSQFWVYWAVTIPVTILVVTSWLLWLRRGELIRRQAAHDRKALAIDPSTTGHVKEIYNTPPTTNLHKVRHPELGGPHRLQAANNNHHVTSSHIAIFKPTKVEPIDGRFLTLQRQHISC